MYRNLFIAWYCFGVIVLSYATFGILMLFIEADSAVASLGIHGLLVFAPFLWFVLFPREKTDERDYLFLQRAAMSGLVLGGVTVFSMGVVIGLSSQFAFERTSIPLPFFWFTLHTGLVTGVITFSALLMRLYRKEEPTEHKGQINEL